MNFQINGEVGWDFVSGMMQTEKQWQIARIKFTEFLKNNSFDGGWHIHNGWVMCDGKCGLYVLKQNSIEVTIVPSQQGYNFHGLPCPGKEYIILKDSPTGDEVKPFEMFVYHVTHEKLNYGTFRTFSLVFDRSVKCIYNKDEERYNFYVKPKNLIKRFLGL